jgi:hypothetical protein
VVARRPGQAAPQSFNFPKAAEQRLEDLWHKRKRLVSTIRKMRDKCEVVRRSDGPDDVKSAVWEAYEHNSRPILTEIWNMEDEFPALPHSANKAGAMLLLSLEHTAFDAAETPDDPADISTKNTLQCIESLSHLLSGSIARDAQDLLSRRDRPIRDLACLCP